MTSVLLALVTASMMLTLACVSLAFLLRRFHVARSSLRQTLLVCAMLQGLMLFRFPVELPWKIADEGAVPWGDLETLDDRGGRWLAPHALPGGREQSTATPQRLAQARSDLFTAGGETDPHSLFAAVGPWLRRNWIATLFVVWLSGLIVVVFRALYAYLRLCHLISRLDAAPADWNGEWTRTCHRQHVHPPPMLVAETVGPMLVRRPTGYVLIVPAEYWHSLSAAQRRGVLMHELAHLRRGDVWRQLIIRSSAAIHWWNPIAWWGVRRFEEACEWACDEFLSRQDRSAATGLASSLVGLVEFLNDRDYPAAYARRGLGVQSMAAPPLVERVNRLIQPSCTGDTKMKQAIYGILAACLLVMSAIQFRLVAAPPGDSVDEGAATEQATSLDVLSPQVKSELDELRSRLDLQDPLTRQFSQLLDDETGRIAVAGLIDGLVGQSRQEAESEALPRWVTRHFAESDDNKLSLRPESRVTAEAWIKQGPRLAISLEEMSTRMRALAARIEDDGDANQFARRLLTDPHAALVIMHEKFEGRVDPIERFLVAAFEDILVRRGKKMIVIPTLDRETRERIERFAVASKIFPGLQSELPAYAKEFAVPDDRHKRFVEAMGTPEMAAILSVHLSDDGFRSSSAAIDRLIEQLEELSVDSPRGLVIRNREGWESIEELLEQAKRAGRRISDVRLRMKEFATQIDRSDPLSARFASELESGVVAYYVAAEIPYAELDAAEEITSMMMQVIESGEDERLRIREEAMNEVTERASEILAGCRTVRRYLRRIDAQLERLEDAQLAAQLSESRTLLLTEVFRAAEAMEFNPVEILEDEFFTTKNGMLRVNPDHDEAVADLLVRAEELNEELQNNDF